MQIYGPTHVHGPQSLAGPHSARPLARPASPTVSAPGDQLDISEAAQLVSQTHDLPEIREDLVARVRSQIASGNYETAERFDVAVDRLFDEIG